MQHLEVLCDPTPFSSLPFVAILDLSRRLGVTVIPFSRTAVLYKAYQSPALSARQGSQCGTAVLLRTVASRCRGRG